MTSFPMLVQFLISMVIIIASIGVGYRLGLTLQNYKKSEKEGMISVISGSILGLLSFMLAFTFGIVSERHDTRKALVRDEAYQIGTVWQKMDFMSEPDRAESKKLIKEYLDLRTGLIKSADVENLKRTIDQSDKILDKLWSLAITHAKTDLNSDVGALYFESLNRLTEIEGLRIAIAYRGHISTGFWVSLYILLVCAMLSIGYYGVIIESKMGFASLILAFSFSVVLGIISNLDQLQTKHFEISQQPLIDLQNKISAKQQ